MHDVPAQLVGMGVKVSGGLVKAEEASDKDVLKNFEILPKLFSGRQITIEFSLAVVRAAYPEDCEALNLEHGAAVNSTDRRPPADVFLPLQRQTGSTVFEPQRDENCYQGSGVNAARAKRCLLSGRTFAFGTHLRSSDRVVAGDHADALQSNGDCKKHSGLCSHW
jgi:hypothetical protein